MSGMLNLAVFHSAAVSDLGIVQRVHLTVTTAVL
jgi:hypothetical protein